ncbi:MAG: Stp1/IreP family PP2C-type Ser/Thr phosphatase [Myxococcota bacterium]|nr:Stp1/IreP family PP2C-type Ser/Thr phosphatase [Myxococcota bacterium]
MASRRSDSWDLVIASATDVGLVRKANQDHCGDFTNAAGCRLVVVADGMGGHAGGEVASRTCVEHVGELFGSASGDPETFLREAMQQANDRVYRMGIETPGLRGMGTTAVAMLFDPARRDRAWVAHVGDSRAYRLHRGQLQRITDDHSWVFEEVRKKRLTPEEAEVHPRRNALLRSIGVDTRVETEVQTVPVASGDRFVLCSDGLWGEVDDEGIAVIMAGKDPEPGAQALVDLANLNGGRDNVTVAFVAVPGPVDAVVPGSIAPGAARPRDAGRRRTLGVAAAVLAGAALVLLTWIALG